MQTLNVILQHYVFLPVGQLQLAESAHFNITKYNASDPEFTITCRTKGGPARKVRWRVDDGDKVKKIKEWRVIMK